jgi:VanZ family protein
MNLLLTISHSRFRLILITPVLTQMITLLYMAFRGRPAMNQLGPDWILHVCAYCILSVLAWIAIHGIFPTSDPSAHRWAGAILSILFAFIDEGIQHTVTVRTFELSDIAADTAGALAGLLLVSLYLKYNANTSP